MFIYTRADDDHSQRKQYKGDRNWTWIKHNSDYSLPVDKVNPQNSFPEGLTEHALSGPGGNIKTKTVL